jgi:hypothetical protein
MLGFSIRGLEHQRSLQICDLPPVTPKNLRICDSVMNQDFLALRYFRSYKIVCMSKSRITFVLYQGRRFIYKNYGAMLPSLAQCFGVFAKPNHSAKYPPVMTQAFLYP